MKKVKMKYKIIGVEYRDVPFPGFYTTIKILRIGWMA